MMGSRDAGYFREKDGLKLGMGMGMGMNMSGLQRQSAGTLVCLLFNISSIYLLFNPSFQTMS